MWPGSFLLVRVPATKRRLEDVVDVVLDVRRKIDLLEAFIMARNLSGKAVIKAGQ